MIHEPGLTRIETRALGAERQRRNEVSISTDDAISAVATIRELRRTVTLHEELKAALELVGAALRGEL